MNANFALQDRFLKRFFAGPLGQHFYLTGGTALARFYFHHRESLDLELARTKSWRFLDAPMPRILLICIGFYSTPI
jgi:hypothetical protein